MRSTFKQTLNEIKAAYSPTSTGRAIRFEFNSKYRRIVVLDTEIGFEIRCEYKGESKEFNKTTHSFWGKKEDAIAWAQYFSENRYVRISSNMTMIEPKVN